ncbi:MAG: GNAT family N-acetyltransferase [Ardenticatenaceae bacterium]|nr:GNAT family N-acetyltransferase [Ardenticatenaceae bacterium]
MVGITSRFCKYAKDQKYLTDFLLEYRSANDVRLYPTIWRVRLLLTSRVWEPNKDVRIWQNSTGQIVGFVMLWRRRPNSPYIVLDGFAHPKFVTKELLMMMFEWGNKRAKDIGLEQHMNVTVFANGFYQDIFAEQLLTTFGYTPVVPNPDEHNVYLSKTLDNEILIPPLPDGYTILRLQETSSLEQYQSLSSFAQVNSEHQKELLESDEYSHFVIADQDGQFAAYCECSICRAEWDITNNRIGWIDYVETNPACQKRGFGEAALLSGLAQLRDWNADTAMLITINTNIPAMKLYDKVGFEPVPMTEPRRYEKEIVYSS